MKQLLFILSLILLLPLLSACERAPQPLPEKAVILAFGDSITFGKGANPNESYPAVLEGLVGRKVVNAGVLGETTAAGVARLPTLLEEVKPKLVIICHGGEDMIQSLDGNKLMANLRTMIEQIRKSGSDVLLVAVPPPAAFYQPAPFYNLVARETKSSIEVLALSNILSDKNMQSEGIYPNAKGYAALAKALAKRITSAKP